MPIYRCNQCALISEQTTSPVGSKVACARCTASTTVFDTVYYVEKLIERYAAAVREVNLLRQAASPTAANASAAVSPATGSSNSFPNGFGTPARAADGAPAANLASKAPTQASAGASALPSALALANTSGTRKLGGLGNLNNSKQLATAEQHAPLQAWFSQRNIEATLDFSLVDTTGFFDDAALQIGQGYALFSELIDRVRYAYRIGQSWINLQIANLSQKDQQALTQLCKNLYNHTFFARYHYQKQEKTVNLTLQTATAVKQFFEGGWLEWYAFMTLVAQLDQRQRGFSCARSVKIVFPNEDLHELDVFVLPQDQPPICIECKSGEFRRDIDKYLRMRKRLGLERGRFIICAADLSSDECNGLSAMYELTFVNLESLGAHLQTLF